MTIDASVDKFYSPRIDGYVNIKSMDFPDKEYFHLSHDLDYILGFWGTDIREVVQALQEDHGLKV